jgi:hypothetical protein
MQYKRHAYVHIHIKTFLVIRFIGCQYHSLMTVAIRHSKVVTKGYIWHMSNFRHSLFWSVIRDHSFIKVKIVQRSRGSSDRIVSEHGLDDRGLIHDRGRGFFF